MDVMEAESPAVRIKRTTISFVEFNKLMDEIPDFEDATYRTSKWRARAIYAMVITCAIGLSISYWPVSGMAKIWIGGTSLVIEVIALMVLVISTYRQDLPGIRAPRIEYAQQLDFDTCGHFDILDWLNAYDTEVLNTSRDFTKLRRTRMEQKLPLLIGGAQSFGLLPLAGVIYLQAHEFSKVGHLGWLEGFSILLLAMFYYSGFLATVVKQRLDAMDMYLEEAVRLRVIGDTQATL